jgi:hypothetical protein
VRDALDRRGPRPGRRDRGPLPPQPEEEARPDPDGPRSPRAGPSGSTSSAAPSTWPPGSTPRSVSFWSGIVPDPVSEDEGLDRLVEALGPVLAHAETEGIRLAFEPEPGMFIDTFARFARLDERIRHPLFDLTVDLGHAHCIEDRPVADDVRTWGPRIANVHIEDMVRGVHDHLMFGEGTMDFPPILQALRDVRLRRRPARRAQPPQPHGRRGRAPRRGVPQPAARGRSALSRTADPLPLVEQRPVGL